MDWDPRAWEDRRRVERTDQHDDDTLSAEHAQPKAPRVIHPFGTADSDVNPLFLMHVTDAIKLVEQLWGKEAAEQYRKGLKDGGT